MSNSDSPNDETSEETIDDVLDEDERPEELLSTLNQARSKIISLQSRVEELQDKNAGLRFELQRAGVEVPDKYEP